MSNAFNKIRFAFVCAAAVLGHSGNALAVSVPLNVTGWDRDIIAEAASTKPYDVTSNDYTGSAAGSSWVFYETGAPHSTQGLPSSGSFTSAFDSSVTFQFQPYTDNNSVQDVETSLTLETPAKVASLAFLVSTIGAGDWQPRLNFSDSTSTLVSVFSNPNWTGSGDVALNNIGLVPRGNAASTAWPTTGFYTNNLDLSHNAYDLSPTDQTKWLTSIDFIPIITAGTDHRILLAVSGDILELDLPPVPEPSSLLIWGLGTLVITTRNRRVRRHQSN